MKVYVGALGLAIEAVGADVAPAILHDQAPSPFGLHLVAHQIAPAALLAEGRCHPPDLELPVRNLQPSRGGFPYQPKRVSLRQCHFACVEALEGLFLLVLG